MVYVNRAGCVTRCLGFVEKHFHFEQRGAHATACSLNPQHFHIFITENESNYLCLPELANTIAIFGSSYGLQAIGGIEWVEQREVFYWGDIDTHGFAILNELRASLPEVKSLLMDSDALLAHESFWVSESKPANRLLPR